MRIFTMGHAKGGHVTSDSNAGADGHMALA